MNQLLWAPGDPLSIEQAISQGADFLDQFALSYSHGTDNSVDEAAWLVLEAMGLSPQKAPDYQKQLSSEEKVAVATLLQRRIDERIPVAYMTRRAWFAGLEFYVDERVLVPRSPLAEPIMQGFCEYLDSDGVSRILDMCTGSACIAVACAYAFANAKVDAVDISDDALQVARLNIKKHDLQDRISVLKSDVYEQLNSTRSFDLIISNPPYVDDDDMNGLHDEFKHEPRLGLAAGEDGLAIINRILAQSADFLNPGGVLICEVGNSASALQRAYPQLEFSWLQFSFGGEGVFLLTREQLQVIGTA